MPEFKVRTPEGRYFNVTVPPGTTKEQALAYAQAHQPPPQGALDPAPIVNAPGTEPGGIWDRIQSLSRKVSPKGFYGPGLIAHGATGLQKLVGMTPETPQENYNRTVPGLETIADIAGGLVAPQRNFLQRMGSGLAVPALVKTLGGNSPGAIMEHGLQGGVGQLLAEIFGGLGKGMRLGSLANTARAEFDKTMAAQASKMAHDKAMLGTLESMDKANYDKLVGKLTAEHEATKARLMSDYGQKVSSHENLLAGTIMDDAKREVPAWADLPSTVAGLYTAVLGKGKELLSDAFQKALDAAKGTARGKTIDIPVSDAQRLGVAVRESTTPLTQRGQESGDLRMLVPVDAAELIDVLPGLKDKALKARSHDALAQADLGIDPKAMREYTVGKGTMEMVDQNKIFKFDDKTNQYQVDRTALAEGLLSRKHMDTIQNREMGDFDTNKGLQVAKAGPLAPEIPPLQLPEPPAPRGPLGNPTPPIDPDVAGLIRTLHIPGTQYGRMKAGSALGGLPGAAIGAAIPKGIVTKAPMSPLEEMIHQLAPAAAGIALRNIGDTSQAEAGPIPPEDPLVLLQRIKDLDEIRAVQSGGTPNDPRLQLDISESR